MLSILVPTDYSPEAKNAMLYAYHFALYTNSTLILYHAMPALIPISDIPYENYYLDEMEEKNMLQDTFNNILLAKNIDPGLVKTSSYVDIQNQVTFGINEAFKRFNCDLVIMGTHGASGFRKIFLGSNTAKLIGDSEFPVLAIPGAYQFEPIYHLIYASDLNDLEDELELLIPFAKVFDAVLEIFYFDYAGPESEKLIVDAEIYIKSLAYNGISLSIKKGNLQLNLTENLKKHINYSNTQILVMYRGLHTWFDNLVLGSNSQKMVFNAGLPILVMQKR